MKQTKVFIKYKTGKKGGQRYLKNHGSIDLKDISKYELGSTEWQDAMIHNLREKKKKGEELGPIERAFVPVQSKHMKNQGMAWNVKQAEKEGRIIREMRPRDYLKKTGTSDEYLKTFEFDTYADTEKGKSRPIKELAEKIKSEDTLVDLPMVEDSFGGHEGRHRALAAEIAGEGKIPVIVPIPIREREELAEKFIKERFPESGKSYQEGWRHRFKQGMPQDLMDSESHKAMVKVKKEYEQEKN